MDNYIYITLRINNINGEVEVMSTKNVMEKKDIKKDIFDVYKLLNIPMKSIEKKDNYQKVTKYDYSQRSSLDINTYAKI